MNKVYYKYEDVHILYIYFYWIFVHNHIIIISVHHHLPSLFPTILGSASSQTRFSWISVFYMERLPVGPPQPSNWVIPYPMVRLGVRL